MNLMKKLFFTFFIAFLLAGGIFAQSADSELDDLPEDLLKELSDQEQAKPNPALQRNFTIIMAEHGYNLNPHTAAYSSEAQILDSIYEGLYSYNPKTLEPMPAIASDFKISRDKKRWTFTIRNNAKFSDGTAITAKSVKDSWIALLKTKNAPYASLLDCIAGAEDFRNGKGKESEVGINVRDDSTLVVTLNVPTAHFAKLLCHHAFSVQKKGAYSGAFVLKEQSAKKIVLEKNQKYWDAKNVSLPQITILSSNDIKENSWQFNDGSVDWISGVADVKSLLTKKAVRLSAIFGTHYLFFTCKNAPWSNADFRNALLTAVPWEKLRKGSIHPATSLVFPLSGYPAVEGISETSPEDAVDMMKDARKKAKIKENEKLTLTYGISNGSNYQMEQYEILKKAWEPLGVELKLEKIDDAVYISQMGKSKCDLFDYSWIGDFADPVAFLELFRKGSTLNPTKWENQKFNEYMEKATLSNDPVERYKLLSQAEQTLLDDGEILPVSYSFTIHVVNPAKVGGWVINALDIHPFKYIFLKDADMKQKLPNAI